MALEYLAGEIYRCGGGDAHAQRGFRLRTSGKQMQADFAFAERQPEKTRRAGI